MVEKKLEIIFKEQASDSITGIMIYISEQGYPETAQKFKKELYNFGNSLINFPQRYPICRKPSFTKKKYRCAVYKKKYIFIYKPLKNKLVIYNVIHSSRYIY